MAKSWKPKQPKAFQPYKLPKLPDPFKVTRQPKAEELPHVMTAYEEKLIEQLCPVVRNKQLIRFWYTDKTTDFSDWRTVEPHLIGRTKYKAANIWLVAWFVPTSAQLIAGHEAKWVNYILDDISQVEVIQNGHFSNRPNYNRFDERMETIFCATL